jgi:hypothetical protein
MDASVISKQSRAPQGPLIVHSTVAFMMDRAMASATGRGRSFVFLIPLSPAAATVLMEFQQIGWSVVVMQLSVAIAYFQTIPVASQAMQ